MMCIMAKVDFDEDVASVLVNDSGLKVNMKVDSFAPQEYNKDDILSVFKAIDTTISLASGNLKNSYSYVKNCNTEVGGLPMADLVEIPFLDVDIDSTLSVDLLPTKIPLPRQPRDSDYRSSGGDSEINNSEYSLLGNFVHGTEVSIISKNSSW